MSISSRGKGEGETERGGENREGRGENEKIEEKKREGRRAHVRKVAKTVKKRREED